MYMYQHQHLRTTVKLLVIVVHNTSTLPPHVHSFKSSVRPILLCQDIVAGQYKMLIISSDGRTEGHFDAEYFSDVECALEKKHAAEIVILLHTPRV